MSNIFGNDARRTADFAFQYGFAGIDWSPEPLEQETDFLARMEELSGLEVRLHCDFAHADMALPGEGGATALECHRQWAERAAMAGIRQMTVQMGPGNVAVGESSFQEGSRNLKKLVEDAAGMGVTVSLKNLATPFSGDPFIFNALVAASGCFVTVDVGSIVDLRGEWPAISCRDYVAPCRQRALNVRIGSPAAAAATVLSDSVDLLLDLPACRWWALSAPTPRELIGVREMVEERLFRLVPPLSLELLLMPFAARLQPA